MPLPCSSCSTKGLCATAMQLLQHSTIACHCHAVPAALKDYVSLPCSCCSTQELRATPCSSCSTQGLRVTAMQLLQHSRIACHCHAVPAALKDCVSLPCSCCSTQELRAAVMQFLKIQLMVFNSCCFKHYLMHKNKSTRKYIRIAYFCA